MNNSNAREADKAEYQYQGRLRYRDADGMIGLDAQIIRKQHNAFVGGSGTWRPVHYAAGVAFGIRAEDGRDQEWIPDILPAPLLARGRGGRTRSTPHSGSQGGGLELFSDAEETSENTEDNNTTTQFNFGGGNQNAEGDINALFVFKGASADNTVLTPTKYTPFHPPRKLPTLAQKEIMAGRGRGRGGFNPGQLKGANWDYDPTATFDTKPSELFPPHPNLKKPTPLTPKELREVNNYRNFQAKVHRGPLFTQSTKRNADAPTKTFSEEQFNMQYGGNAKADMDPFTGVETYSMRFVPKKHALPKLSDASFDKSLFPEELWDTLDGTSGAEVKKHVNRAMVRKAQLLAGGGDNKEKTKLMLEKINNAVDGVDDEDDEEEDEAAVDSEFEDDDGGDYDAEQYFDGGEDGDDDEGEDGGQES